MLWEKCEYKISKTRKLLIDHLDLPDHCCVTFIGSNGRGKTSEGALRRASAGLGTGP